MPRMRSTQRPMPRSPRRRAVARRLRRALPRCARDADAGDGSRALFDRARRSRSASRRTRSREGRDAVVAQLRHDLGSAASVDVRRFSQVGHDGDVAWLAEELKIGGKTFVTTAVARAARRAGRSRALASRRSRCRTTPRTGSRATASSGCPTRSPTPTTTRRSPTAMRTAFASQAVVRRGAQHAPRRVQLRQRARRAHRRRRQHQQDVRPHQGDDPPPRRRHGRHDRRAAAAGAPRTSTSPTPIATAPRSRRRSACSPCGSRSRAAGGSSRPSGRIRDSMRACRGMVWRRAVAACSCRQLERRRGRQMCLAMRCMPRFARTGARSVADGASVTTARAYDLPRSRLELWRTSTDFGRVGARGTARRDASESECSDLDPSAPVPTSRELRAPGTAWMDSFGVGGPARRTSYDLNVAAATHDLVGAAIPPAARSRSGDQLPHHART